MGADDVARTADLPVPAAAGPVERGAIGVAGQRQPAIAVGPQRRGEEDDLRVEPFVDLPLDEVVQQEADGDAGHQQHDADEQSGAGQQASADGERASHHAGLQVRR